MNTEQRQQVIALLRAGNINVRFQGYANRAGDFVLWNSPQIGTFYLKETGPTLGFFGCNYEIMRGWSDRVCNTNFANECGWENVRRELRPDIRGDSAVWFSFSKEQYANSDGNWYDNRQQVISETVILYNVLRDAGIFAANFNALNYDVNNGQQGGIIMSDQTSLTEKIKQLLEHNLQVILTGAPGTGKTYTAKKVAFAMTGDTEDTPKDASHIASVQFHPGYDYSDFVVGMKPVLILKSGEELEMKDGKYVLAGQSKEVKEINDAQVSFRWKDGIFKKFADKAKGDLDHNYVFLIDEINRADLSRVFGELFSLLEEDYRYCKEGETEKNAIGITLPNGDNFVIPKNLYIIGTMNDIDRSVESMDFALRRRFAWYEVTADSSMCIIDHKAKNGKIVQGDADKLKRAMKVLNDIIDPSSKADGAKVAIGQDTAGTLDLRLGSEYQLGGAIFAKLEKYVKDGNGNLRDDPSAFEDLWNNHIKNILSEYLRGRNDRTNLINQLKDRYDNAVKTRNDSDLGGRAPIGANLPNAEPATENLPQS